MNQNTNHAEDDRSDHDASHILKYTDELRNELRWQPDNYYQAMNPYFESWAQRKFAVSPWTVGVGIFQWDEERDRRETPKILKINE